MEFRLDADVRRQLYLIFKEAINNAARHSRCTQAEIEFDVAEGRLLLLVRDNGRGFDRSGDAAASKNGAGLVSMRERAQALGGEIEIISSAVTPKSAGSGPVINRERKALPIQPGTKKVSMTLPLFAANLT